MVLKGEDEPMKGFTAIINEKTGEITIDFWGYQGGACHKAAQRLIKNWESKGVKINVKDVQPKEDTSVRERQSQLVRESF